MINITLDEKLPESSTLFYRARFEVFPDDNINAEIWPQIIRVLYNWIKKKEHHRKSRNKPNIFNEITRDIIDYSDFFDITYQDCDLPKSFAEGSLSCSSKSSSLNTAATKGTGSEHVPQFWAFDYLEKDSEKKFRRWRTSVGVTASTSGTYIVNVRVSIYDDATFMGQALIPERNTPNFIEKLLTIKNCVTMAGECYLTNKPIEITAENFEEFIDELEMPSRVTPIVVISSYWNECKSTFEVDAKAFAKKMAGSAIVYTLNKDDQNVRSKYTQFFINNEEVKAFRIPNGGIRIFLPKLNFSNKNDSRRHRFFTHQQLDKHNINRLSDDICVGISKLYQQRPDEVIDPASVQAQENKIQREALSAEYHKLKKERALLAHSISAAGTKDDDQTAEKEIESLQTRISQLEYDCSFYEKYIESIETMDKSETEGYKARINELEQNVNELDNSNSQLQFELESSRANYVNLTHEKDSLQNQLEIWNNIEQFPNSPLDTLNLASELYIDRIYVLPEAFDSSKDFSGDTNEVFQILRAINNVLWPLLFSDTDSEAIATNFKNRTGFELSFRETKNTKKNSKLAKKRVRIYDGRSIDITPHIKGKSGGRVGTLRIHFYKDESKKLIVIGHCGAHMETAGTKRKK